MMKAPKTKFYKLILLLLICLFPAQTFAAPFGSMYERTQTSTGNPLPEGVVMPKVSLPVKAPNFSGGGAANTPSGGVTAETGVISGDGQASGAQSGSVSEILADYYERFNYAGDNGNNLIPGLTQELAQALPEQAFPEFITAGASRFSLRDIMALNGEADETNSVNQPNKAPASIEPDLVVLKETYDTALGLYEQKFEIGRSFLTNIPNGASTSDIVALDIPKNMKVTAEFDGAYITYTDKQKLTETGYYVFTVSCPKVTEEGSYRAIFSFRILPPPANGIDEAGITKEIPLKPEYFNTSSNNGNTTIEYVFANHKRFYANVADGETPDRPVHFLLSSKLGYGLKRNGKSVSYANNKPITEPGQYLMRVTSPAFETKGRRAVTLYTDISFTILNPEALAEAGAEGAQSAPGIPQTVADTLIETVRNGVSLLSFSNGEAFAGSISNGDTAGEAIFAIPSSIEYVLYRGNEIVSYLSGDRITEPGSYTLSLKTQPDAENRSYTSDFEFEIAAPEGTEKAVEPIEAAEAENPDKTESADSDNADETPSAPVTAEGKNIPEQTWTGEVFNQFIAIDTYFTSTIPNGIISGEQAKFSIPQNVPRQLFYNGEELDILGDETLSEPGEYALITKNPLTGGEYLFYFTILPEYGNKAFGFVPPLGYRIETVTKDSAPVPFAEGKEVELNKDGEYIIQIAGGEQSFPKYVVKYNLDTVAPVLEIEGIKNGKATGTEVFLTPDDPDAKVSVLIDSKSVSWSNGSPLTKYGDYTVTVTDKAGNSSEYEFSIPYKMSGTTILFITLMILLIGAGAFYFMRLRKNVKI